MELKFQRARAYERRAIVVDRIGALVLCFVGAFIITCLL